LTGATVLELGSLIAGPFAGQLLGDYGADVIKVEPMSSPRTSVLVGWPNGVLATAHCRPGTQRWSLPSESRRVGERRRRLREALPGHGVSPATTDTRRTALAPTARPSWMR
jgi:hypothetical protein